MKTSKQKKRKEKERSNYEKRGNKKASKAIITIGFSQLQSSNFNMNHISQKRIKTEIGQWQYN